MAEMQSTQLIFEPVSSLESQTSPYSFLFARAKFPEQLYGDQVRLKQVLVSLMKNALKFSYNESVKIRACYDY